MRKTVLITGASGGIGSATAKLFAAKGYSVVLHYFQSQDAAEALTEELIKSGTDTLLYRADVCDFAQVSEMVKTTQERFGKIDVLINNAGIAEQRLFTEISEESWDRMMGVNVKGVVHCCKAVLPEMIRRRAGKIINISSIWGVTGASCEVHYSAAKAAVIGLTKALAKEVGPSHIQVNCIAPGVVDTKMNGALNKQALQEIRESTPLGVIGQPEDIASAIYFLASEEAAFITGQVLSPNGGFVI